MQFTENKNGTTLNIFYILTLTYQYGKYTSYSWNYFSIGWGAISTWIITYGASWTVLWDVSNWLPTYPSHLKWGELISVRTRNFFTLEIKSNKLISFFTIGSSLRSHKKKKKKKHLMDNPQRRTCHFENVSRFFELIPAY